jgi:hypothetical protein
MVTNQIWYILTLSIYNMFIFGTPKQLMNNWCFISKRNWLLCLTVIALFGSCTTEEPSAKKTEKEPTPEVVLLQSGVVVDCDLENLDATGASFVTENGQLVAGGAQQSNEQALSGKHSIKVNKEKQFGLAYILKNIQPGDHFKVSVKRLSNTGDGVLVATANTANEIEFYASNRIAEKSDEQWKTVELMFNVPPDIIDGQLKIYVWNKSASDVYFDDLKIELLVKEEAVPEFSVSPVHLEISSEGMEKLAAKRVAAFKSGFLESTGSDWVKAKWITAEDTLKAKVRLKGDVLGHLLGGKWSMRVKLKKGKTWNGMSEFSLNRPEAGNFLNEYVLRKWWEKEGVLTPSYQFVPVILNGNGYSIYAVDEHFRKELLAKNNRERAPLMRFAEGDFWKNKVMINSGSKFSRIPFPDFAHIDPYDQNLILVNKKHYRYFMEGQRLMKAFQKGTLPATQIFDTEALAKYYAITDLTKSHHGLIWRNQRYYYNPAKERLEMVGFDGYEWTKTDFNASSVTCGFFERHATIKGHYAQYMLFKDVSFAKMYHQSLTRFSDSIYVQGFMQEIEPQLKAYEEMLQTEFPFYTYDRSSLVGSAAEVQKETDDYLAYITAGNYRASIDAGVKPVVQDSIVEDYIHPMLVKVYTQDQKDNRTTLKVFSHHKQTIELLGTGTDNFEMTYGFVTPLVLNFGEEVEALSKEACTWLFFKIAGGEQVYTVKLLPWES